MNEIPTIITERVDDIPLLLEQRQRMGLPTLLDTHFPAHGNWTGLSLGWVSTSWLSSILSQGDHRMVHVEPWVAKRLWTLGTTTGQRVTRVDFTDDRLESVLRRLSHDERWGAFESGLNQHTVRVYALSTERVHVDSTSANAYATVSDGGLLQCNCSTRFEQRVDRRKGLLDGLICGQALAFAGMNNRAHRRKQVPPPVGPKAIGDLPKDCTHANGLLAGVVGGWNRRVFQA